MAGKKYRSRTKDDVRWPRESIAEGGLGDTARKGHKPTGQKELRQEKVAEKEYRSRV